MNGSATRHAPRIAVVGGGIAGLAAAHSLAVHRGASVDLFEADPAIGGKMRSSAFAGLPAVDEGPDAFLARVPEAAGLAREVGLGSSLVSPVSAGAALWWDRLHPIPEGLLLGMPTGIGALSRSRLLTRRGRARAALEPFLPSTPTGADSLGAFVRARFGAEVHERLVDPLIGSIYAADTDRFSLAAVPQIAELAAAGRSVLVTARRRPAPPAASSPVFLTPAGGMAALGSAVADAVVAAGGRVHRSAAVESIMPARGGWAVSIAGGHEAAGQFDAVVIATPATCAAPLLRTAGAIDAAALIGDIEAADVAIVTVAIDANDWPSRLRGLSGYLVPKPVQRLVTAVSFGSQKWAQWDDGRSVVLRISLGRDGLPVLHLDDDALIAAAVAESGRHLGLELQPTAIRLTRWPSSFPQYRPRHAERIASARALLPAGLAVAGASCDGIGIPACVRSAVAAAARVAT